MEQTTAGSGVSWVRNLFPKAYYSYNIGENTCVSEVNGDPYRKVEITFPSSAGTVYGGTLTVNKDGSGELVVDRKTIIFDGVTSGRYVTNTGSRASTDPYNF